MPILSLINKFRSAALDRKLTKFGSNLGIDNFKNVFHKAQETQEGQVLFEAEAKENQSTKLVLYAYEHGENSLLRANSQYIFDIHISNFVDDEWLQLCEIYQGRNGYKDIEIARSAIAGTYSKPDEPFANTGPIAKLQEMYIDR